MAGEASKVRFVRCPNCRRLLVELADVPVYKCGGCRTVLQAKHQCADKGNITSEAFDCMSSKKNLLENGSEFGKATSSGATTFNKQSGPFSVDPSNIDVACMEHNVLISEKFPCSKSEKNDNKEETLKCNENASKGASLGADSPSSTGNPPVTEKETTSASVEQGQSISSKTDSCISEQSNDSWNLSQHGYGNSSPNHKMEESTGSVISEEDIADGNGPNEYMGTPSMRAHAYDGSISSCDDITNKHERYMLLSRRTFRNPKLSNSTTNKNREGGIFTENNKIADSVSHFPSMILSSKSSNAKCDSAVIDGSNSGQGNLQDSKNLCSSQKEMETNPPPTFLPRDPTYFEDMPCDVLNANPSTRLANIKNDRMELLRKVDEMREHLTRSTSEVKTGNQRLHIRGAGQDNLRPMSCNHESENVLHCRKSNISQCNSRLCNQAMTVEQSQSSLMPWSGQGGSSCSHHHSEHQHSHEELPPSTFCGACTFHIDYEPFTAASSMCCKDCHVTLCCHSSQTIDYHLHKPHPKEKRQILKRHFRPVSGGAPFVTCNNCLQLLHIPADFLVLRGRCHKLKCGACSEVLSFLSRDGGHIVPHKDAQMDPLPCNVNNAMEHGNKDDLTVNHGCVQGDPVSYTEEYGPPFSKGYSTDDETVEYILSSLVNDKLHGNRIIGSQLHRLMGYESATELIYQPCDEDDEYESTATSHFYTSDKIQFSEG